MIIIPPRQASPATPPEEGNYLKLHASPATPPKDGNYSKFPFRATLFLSLGVLPFRATLFPSFGGVPEGRGGCFGEK